MNLAHSRIVTNLVHLTRNKMPPQSKHTELLYERYRGKGIATKGIESQGIATKRIASKGIATESIASRAIAISRGRSLVGTPSPVITCGAQPICGLRMSTKTAYIVHEMCMICA